MNKKAKSGFFFKENPIGLEKKVDWAFLKEEYKKYTFLLNKVNRPFYLLWAKNIKISTTEEG